MTRSRSTLRWAVVRVASAVVVVYLLLVVTGEGTKALEKALAGNIAAGPL